MAISIQASDITDNLSGHSLALCTSTHWAAGRQTQLQVSFNHADDGTIDWTSAVALSDAQVSMKMSHDL